ncbi:hypothetical protein [uncultured Aquimarina sp.]|uniref:hypothetical protein n=1 Tax=uncultured Aquimarina sp. TaxID=575652 RepID=UPI002639DA8D|nr:hypothetical protein [uncultured Aquimarina sp.]
MPDIKNEDLLSLHYQIEKAEVEQQKLEDLLNDKSVELKKNRASKMMLKMLCSVLLIITIALIIYAIFWVEDSDSSVAIDNKEFSSFQSEINGLKNQLNELKNDQSDIKNIKDLYLYRSLINKDTVYSVQIQSFTKDKVSFVSEKFTNTLFYNDTYYYKLSLGIFETLEEAQKFRKILLQSGIIDKNIFVISYKEGERIRIENPF